MKSPIAKGLVGYLCIQSLLLVIFYFPWLSNQTSYYYRDLTHFIEPFARFTGSCMNQMQLPLWNPFLYCGMSQMSLSLQGIFYPPTWLFALLPFNSALAANMLLHQVLCGLGGFLLICALGWGCLPATVCALVLAMSGYAFGFTSIFSLVGSSAWGPLTLWSMYELGHNFESSKNFQHAKWTAIASISLCLLILSGYHDLTSTECLLIGVFIVYSAYCSWKKGAAGWIKILILRIKAVILGVLLAMPALLPTCEWLLLSRRSSGLDMQEALLLSANWYDLICMLLPQPLGDLQSRWSEFRPLVMPGQMVPYLASAFVGPIVWTLAIWSLADKTWKERWLVLSLLLCTLILAMGVNTPVVPFLLNAFKIPVRFPIKQMFLPVFFLSVMAARGLYGANSGLASQKTSFVFWLLLSSIALSLLAGMHPLDIFFSSEQLSSIELLLRKAEPILAWNLLVASAVGIILNLVLMAARRANFQKGYSLALIVCTAASLLFYGCAFSRTAAPKDYFEKPSVVANLIKKLEGDNVDRSRVLGLYLERFTVPTSLLDKNNLKASVETFQYSRQVLRTNTNIDYAIPSSFGFEGTPTGDYYHFFHNCYALSSQAFGENPQLASDAPLANFCKFTATKYALTQMYRFINANSFSEVPNLDPRLFKQIAWNKELNVRVYELLNGLPRAYFSDCWEWSDGHSQSLDRIFDVRNSKFDPSKVTLLERGKSTVRAAAAELPEITKDNSVQIRKDEMNSLEIEVNAIRPGYLVLADQYYPGWQAAVDGTEAEILVANGFTRAVSVPQGKHVVSFVYRPMSLMLGVVFALVGFLWLLSLLVFSKKAQDG